MFWVNLFNALLIKEIDKDWLQSFQSGLLVFFVYSHTESLLSGPDVTVNITLYSRMF